jgi:hypothetical protein
VIIENYPTNLIIKDRWGALPLLYAFWGAAPTEIIQFLLKSYINHFYPGHVFNWTMMVEIMGRTDIPMECVENLLHVKQMHFPDQTIDWVYLLDKFELPSHYVFVGLPFQERMNYPIMCGMSDRVEALAFKVWCDHMTDMIHTTNFHCDIDITVILRRIQAKVAHFEDKYPRLKEITSILELALWKSRMNESHLQKKINTDKSSIRRQCRMTCGADVVINLVLLYLMR